MQDTYWMTDFGKQVKFRLHEADPTFSSRLKVVDLVTGQDEVVFP